MGLEEIWREQVNWICWAQNRSQQWDCVNAAMNLAATRQVGYLLSTWARSDYEAQLLCSMTLHRQVLAKCVT